jgi:hypothetical protein
MSWQVAVEVRRLHSWGEPSVRLGSPEARDLDFYSLTDLPLDHPDCFCYKAVHVIPHSVFGVGDSLD